MSITLAQLERITATGSPADWGLALVTLIARERGKAPRKAPGPTGKGHALCVSHAVMPDGITSLTGKWLCWATRAPTDREVEARRRFVAEVERSAIAAHKRWESRPAPDGKLAWLDGKRVRPSQLLRERAKRAEPDRRYDTVLPGDAFDTLAPVKPRGYKPGVAGFRSKLVSTRRRSRKSEIVVRSRA
jgi:hypothetical protein